MGCHNMLYFIFFCFSFLIAFVAFDIDIKTKSRYLPPGMWYGKNLIKFGSTAHGWHYLNSSNISDPISQDKNNNNYNDKTGSKDENERYFDVVNVAPCPHLFLPFHSVNIKCCSNNKYWTHRNDVEWKEIDVESKNETKIDYIQLAGTYTQSNDSDCKSYNDDGNSDEMIQFSDNLNMHPSDEYNEYLFFLAPIHLWNFTNEYYIGYLDIAHHKECFEKKSGFHTLFGKKKQHQESSYHWFLSLLSYVYFDYQTKTLKITNDIKKATSYGVKYEFICLLRYCSFAIDFFVLNTI